jgi:sugar/nucleoside kinase (ribokinase family)
MRLLHLGNVAIDLVLTVGDLPVRGGDVLASSTTTTPGGGFNVMTAAVRQGLPTLYAGAHGNGPFGALARDALESAGINWLHPAREDLDTGFVVTLVDSTGERTFVTSPGAEATLTRDELPTPADDDLVYLSGYSLLHDANRAALLPWLCQLPNHVEVFFDPGPLVAEIPDHALEAVLARVDWWSSNAAEATALTGLTDPAEAARAVRRRTLRADVLVRTGPSGCLVAVRGQGVTQVDGFAVRAVDLNGAGDAHAGAFLAAIAEGKEPVEAARRANAAAALAVTRRGPATAPTRDELEAYLRGL